MNRSRISPQLSHFQNCHIPYLLILEKTPVVSSLVVYKRLWSSSIWRQNLQCLHVNGNKYEVFGRNKTGQKEIDDFLKAVLPAAAAVADGAEKSSFVL